DRSACRLNHARNLHRDRRSAGYHATVAQPLPARSDERKRIHSGMPSKGAVFVYDERIQVQWRYLIERNRMPPHVIVAWKRPQRCAIARDDNHRVGRVPSRRRKRETAIQCLECEDQEYQPQTELLYYSVLLKHFSTFAHAGGVHAVRAVIDRPYSPASTTVSISLPPLRPKIFGRYISSAYKGGTTNSPGVTTRAR